MSVITLRLPEKLLHDLDSYAEVAHLPRAEYIRRAIEHLNAEMRKNERALKLKKASLRVRKESMDINKEFDGIEHDPKD